MERNRPARMLLLSAALVPALIAAAHAQDAAQPQAAEATEQRPVGDGTSAADAAAAAAAAAAADAAIAAAEAAAAAAVAATPADAPAEATAAATAPANPDPSGQAGQLDPSAQAEAPKPEAAPAATAQAEAPKLEAAPAATVQAEAPTTEAAPAATAQTEAPEPEAAPAATAQAEAPKPEAAPAATAQAEAPEPEAAPAATAQAEAPKPEAAPAATAQAEAPKPEAAPAATAQAEAPKPEAAPAATAQAEAPKPAAPAPVASAQPAAPKADAAPVAPKPAASDDPSTLRGAIAGSWRDPKNVARDGYRHPLETLQFFGLKPEQTVVEITPGGGWYSEILAPFLRQRGRYIAAIVDPDTQSSADSRRYFLKAKTSLEQKFAASPLLYGAASFAGYDPYKPAFGQPNSADVVLTFRNVHNWRSANQAEGMFKAFFEVLKPGGTLGVVEHRAKGDVAADDKSGYVGQAQVIALAEAAGFRLDAKSEVNANPRDSKDHPNGVWTLPPVNRHDAADDGKYQAIGESDRMTLRFRKPR